MLILTGSMSLLLVGTIVCTANSHLPAIVGETDLLRIGVHGSSALENELRDKVRESNAGKRNTESMRPVL